MMNERIMNSIIIGKLFGDKLFDYQTETITELTANDCADLCEYMYTNGIDLTDVMSHVETACDPNGEYKEHFCDDFYRGFLFGQIVGSSNAGLFELADYKWFNDDIGRYGYYHEVCYEIAKIL